MNYIYENKILNILNFNEEIPIEVLMGAEVVVINEGVTTVPHMAFKKAKNLVKVVLPKSLKVIEEEAFLGCDSLKEINLANVEEIQSQAFKGDSALESVNLTNVSLLSNEAFAFCSSLKKVELSKDLKAIPKGCFTGTQNLKQLVLPPLVTKLQESAFKNSGIKDINLDNIEIIGVNCFYGCKNLQKVNLKNVKKLSDYAFSSSKIDNLVLNIDDVPIGCFENCVNLKNIVLINTKIIQSMAFKNTGITNLNLPNSVESLGLNAFADCKHLQTAYLPIKELGLGVFANCNSLKQVKGYVRKIEDKTFANCSSLNLVDFEDLNFIGVKAFVGCRNLIDFNFNKIETIKQGAFSDCQNLCANNKELDLSNVKTLENEAFCFCSKITKVKLPKISTISNSLFYGCKALEQVDIPVTVNCIESNAFKDCVNLKKVNLPKNIKILNESIFMGCVNLSDINIPNELEILPCNIFNHCANLKNIELPKNLKIIENGAFYESGIKEIKLPEKLENISYMAFYGCKNLESIEIPNVKKMSNSAFEDCINLKQMTVPNSLINNDKKDITKQFVLGSKFYESCNLKVFKINYGEKSFEICLNDNEKIKEVFETELNGKNFICFLTNQNLYIKSDNFENEISFKDLQSVKYFNEVFSKEKFNYTLFEYDEKMANFIKHYIYLLTNNCKIGNNDLIFALNLNSSQYEYFQKHKQTYNKVSKKFGATNFDNEMAFFKLCYNLGLMSNDERHIINVLNFINKVLMNDEIITNENIAEKFEGIELNEKINYNLLNFFKNNYKQFERNNECAILTYAINNFEELSKMIPKLNAQTLLQYVNTNAYKNVKQGNEKLAMLVQMAGYGQEDFEEFQKLYDKAQLQPHNVFDRIEIVNREIDAKEKEIISKLIDVVDKDFQFEWLSKHSEYNMVLGNICKCCAKMGGLGFGIMEASSLDPRVQNLVIKNKSGDFVGKSTVYVNKRRQYAVFNNFIVKDKYREGEKGQQVYEAFMRGINAFIEEYDKNNPDLPLLDVTVGMNANKLEKIVKQNLKKSPILYQGAKFQGYAGDSIQEQYVLYSRSQKTNNSEKL